MANTNPAPMTNVSASDFPMQHAPSQRQMEQKAFEVNYYRNQVEELQGQVQMVHKVLEDIENTKKSLTQMDALKKGALLPMGAGVYTKANADKAGAVLIDIGSRVMVEKTPTEALEILEFRKSLVIKNLADITAMFEKTLARYEKLNAEAQQMAKDAQMG
ncbi:prefoldin subunit alpha [Candidatus Micrarchaeota archaeon]|nr:prefoldin subunit alpha [Candidatus Micrarchaeota archaeon]